ncbi:Putative copper-transporting ATPase 3 [Verticillium dahliae VDG2]|nr:Putative copper-transporting ATPase 3 [Verticillium dahliae VDG2]
MAYVQQQVVVAERLPRPIDFSKLANQPVLDQEWAAPVWLQINNDSAILQEWTTLESLKGFHHVDIKRATIDTPENAELEYWEIGLCKSYQLFLQAEGCFAFPERSAHTANRQRLRRFFVCCAALSMLLLGDTAEPERKGYIMNMEIKEWYVHIIEAFQKLVTPGEEFILDDARLLWNIHDHCVPLADGRKPESDEPYENIVRVGRLLGLGDRVPREKVSESALRQRVMNCMISTHDDWDFMDLFTGENSMFLLDLSE